MHFPSNNIRIRGKVLRENSKKFSARFNARSITGESMTYSLDYFKESKKLYISGDFGASYAPLGDASGTCTVAKRINPTVAKLTNNENQNLDQDYLNGRDALKRSDYAEAAKWYRKAAERGDADSQFALGLMYENGDGVPEDYAEAAKWYRKAAKQGDADAQHNLAEKYYWAEGVAGDESEAAKWYRLAAEQGHLHSQVVLGNMYRSGEGIPQDLVKAYMWYGIFNALRRSRGDSRGRMAGMSLRSAMNPYQIEQAEQMAREWLEAHPK